MEELAEIIEDMRQGFCEPILCGDGKGTQFVVKTRSAGRLALIKEWIGSSIGDRLGLPIPRFNMCYLTRRRARLMVHREAEVLAECPGFASSYVKDYLHLPQTTVREVEAGLRVRILLFDWWTLNSDRRDDNPNLLWVPNTKTLHVIDHNHCFDQKLSAADFWESHIFRLDRSALPFLREATTATMVDIIDQVQSVWRQLPEEWLEVSEFGAADVIHVLERALEPGFWNAE